jgi:hypothetical protein
MIIETWEGPHNTLCLQICRDAARSDLLERWRAEISSMLERWPQDFLSVTRSRVEQAFNETTRALSRERVMDQQWVETHARRIVDRMGDLLELAWMSDLAARHANDDATAALLTSVAGYYLLPGENQFDHPIHKMLTRHGASLAEEESIRDDAANL